MLHSRLPFQNFRVHSLFSIRRSVLGKQAPATRQAPPVRAVVLVSLQHGRVPPNPVPRVRKFSRTRRPTFPCGCQGTWALEPASQQNRGRRCWPSCHFQPAQQGFAASTRPDFPALHSAQSAGRPGARAAVEKLPVGRATTHTPRHPIAHAGSTDRAWQQFIPISTRTRSTYGEYCNSLPTTSPFLVMRL